MGAGHGGFRRALDFKSVNTSAARWTPVAWALSEGSLGNHRQHQVMHPCPCMHHIPLRPS